ncbi:MAG TPA: hypothetical protein VJA44_00775 [Acidimicrobiia bacterium]|nr:hypothetical protein [Acidimicrobiia bacterium]
MKPKYLAAMREGAEMLMRDAAWHITQGPDDRALAAEYIRVALLLAEGVEKEMGNSE